MIEAAGTHVGNDDCHSGHEGLELWTELCYRERVIGMLDSRCNGGRGLDQRRVREANSEHTTVSAVVGEVAIVLTNLIHENWDGRSNASPVAVHFHVTVKYEKV